MRTGGWIALALLLCAPLADPAGEAFYERHVVRLVAMPTPVGPLRTAGDEASWRVSVPDHAIVLVEAEGDAGEPFFLRAARANASSDALALPTTHAGFLLSAPGDWRVRVDPLAGVAVDIRVTFAGRVADVSGEPTPFVLQDEPRAPLCLAPGACLP